MEKHPLVSAVVLNFRTPQQATRCVRALHAQSSASSESSAFLEVIVVDNHSCDESIQLLRNRFAQDPHVRILESRENIGYSRGNALGIRHARGKYLLVINPDNELESTGLRTMVAAMERDATIGILAPCLVYPDGSVRDSFRRFPSVVDVLIKRTPLRRLFPGRLRHYLRADEDPRAVQDADWVVGACFLIRRDVYEKIGGLDPRFFLFFEDIDLCRRVRAAGLRVVYFPTVTATDRVHRLSEGGVLQLILSRTGRIHIASALRYFWKWRAGRP